MRILLLFIIVFCLVSNTAASSRAVAGQTLDAAQVAKFAKEVESILASRGARVALVARTGRMAEELPDGVKFTHVGFAVYSSITAEDGISHRGYVMYNLYQRSDDLSKSSLVQDMPFDFFSQSVCS